MNEWMLVSGCRTASPGTLFLLTRHRLSLGVNCVLLARKRTSGGVSLLHSRDQKQPEPIGHCRPIFAFAWKLLAFLYVLEYIRSISVQLSVRNSLFVTCSRGLQRSTTLLFPDLYFVLIPTTSTMHLDHTWRMKRSHSRAPLKVIVSRLSQTVCNKSQAACWVARLT